MSTSRIRSLDLARGLAVLSMVLVHVLGVYGTSALSSSLFGAAVQFLGGPPAAPVFLFLMGASLMLSKRATPSRDLRRGVGLLALAYLLNFLRGTLPALLGLRIGVITLDDLPASPEALFWVGDILHCASLALLILTLIRRALPWPTAWPILAGVVAVASPFLWGRMSGWPPLDRLLTLLWGATEDVSFPVFPWLSYPLAGMAFGHWLAVSVDREASFRRAALGGMALVALGVGVTMTGPAFHIGDYWRSGPGAVIGTTGFVLLWLSVCCRIVRCIPPNPLFRLFYTWSEHVTVFYCLHWIVIAWGVGLVGHQRHGLLAVVLLMIVVAAATDQATRLWVRGWARRPRSFRNAGEVQPR